MSTQVPKPHNYTTGRDRYVRFARDFLDLRLADAQKDVLRKIAEHQRVIIVGANGPGKSYITAALKIGFLLTNTDSIVLGTSGSYQQYEDTMWRPLRDMFSSAQDKYGLPGQLKGGNRPSLELDDEWYAKIVSPRAPGELEGRHNTDVLVVIDEADKKHVTEQHFESAGSSITDLNDKMVAICNPPKDETNVVHKKAESDRWTVIRLSAFDSHNALVDAGRVDEPRIPGLVDLVTIASDWEEWNNRPWPEVDESYDGEWPGMAEIESKLDAGELEHDQVTEWLAPGFDTARTAHEESDTLDQRWYIRRAGVMPPAGAEAHRPIQPEHVSQSWHRTEHGNVSMAPRAVGIDVARSGDETVMVGEHRGVLRVHYSEQGTNHEEQKKDVVSGTAFTQGLRDWPAPEVAVDKGYAPGFHDYVNDRVPNVRDFQNGTKPADLTRWYDKWAEALYHFGQWLEDGGVINDPDLREEAMVAARVVTYEERTLGSRGPDGEDVYQATSKDDVKEELGHSPDRLDAALMAVWVLRADATPTEVNSTWYNPHT